MTTATQTPPSESSAIAATLGVPCNQALRAELLALRETQGLSNQQIARRLGRSPAVVSTYLAKDGCKYAGDVQELERRIVDLLRNEQRRRLSGVTTIDCSVARQVRTAFELARRTNDAAIVMGEAGVGKSRAIELYVEQNPTAILIHVRTWASDMKSLEGALFEAIAGADYDHHTRRSVWVANRLRGSDRIIILDDAHKLTRPACQWIFDLHDETGCPVALVGTNDLEAKITDDPQRFSRVGYCHRIKVESPRALIEHTIRELCTDIAEVEISGLADVVEQVAEQHGYYRAVHKELKLAVEIRSASNKGWIESFRAAHQKLLRKYVLL